MTKLSKEQKTKAIIVDMDGTLADCRHRRQHAEKGDFKAFYKRMGDDIVNYWCRRIIEKFNDTHSILIVSGRPREYQGVTEAWLISNMVHYHDLFMRETGDYRDDTVVKEEIFRENIEKNYDVDFVLDDRAKVVKMWRNLGLTCLQCDEGDF